MTAEISKAILRDDEETAGKFLAWGRAGLPNWAIANRLGVHANTVGTFLRRAPKSRAALIRGRTEARNGQGAGEDGPEQAEAAWRAGLRPAAPRIGQDCPTCGQPYHGKDAVVLTPESIAEAQKKIDALIERYHPGHKAERAASFDDSRNKD